MKPIIDTNFIVVDIETTGSDCSTNRITDLGMVMISALVEVDTFKSLINPHQFIPSFISHMTGISNEMVYKAPEASEVLPLAASMLATPDSVFVAHNVNFDWSFIEKTLYREEIDVPLIPKLCTLKLARRLLPPDMKKGLTALTNYFGIKVKGRHRAFGDAKATGEVLIRLIEIAESEHDITETEELLSFQNKPAKNYIIPATNFTKIENKLSDIPELPGVYYFTDKKGKVIYVGKAKSLKKRVKSYFSSQIHRSKKISELLKKFKDINWITTNNELEALLKESKEIKRLQPKYNSQQKRYHDYHFIRITINDDYPGIEKCYDMENDGSEYYGPFRSSYLASDIVDIIEKQFKIVKCEDYSHKSNRNACLYQQIYKCHAPCTGNVSREIYFEEIDKIRDFLSGKDDGIIRKLQKVMLEHSDNLEFELAGFLKSRIIELERLFGKHKDLPTSINDSNCIIINNTGTKNKHLIMLKEGKYAGELNIRGNTSGKALEELITKVYFNGFHKSLFFTNEDIDEVRIVRGWLNRNLKSGKVITVNGKKLEEVLSVLNAQ